MRHQGRVPLPPPNDTAYNATTWGGDLNAATKNAIRDIIEGILSGTIAFSELSGPAKTVLVPSTDTLTAEEVGGVFLNNLGQGSENTQTLPTAAAGMNGIVQISASGVGAFHLKAGPSDLIYLDGVTLNDGDKASLATPAVGDFFSFASIETAAGVFDWIVRTGQGTLTDGGA